MSSNSEIRPIIDIDDSSGKYCNPTLIKDGSINRLYRVTREGKYFIIKTSKDESGASRSLTRREYELSIGLDHPHIVGVFTFEEHSPVGPGIIMEYIDGRNLNEFLEENPSFQARRRILEQLLDAVAYLHRKGIIHNDLKPENILISRVDNTLKIIDFGLSDSDAYFLTQQLGCTPKYASPELLAYQKTDCRSDIYSLGLLMRDIVGSRYRHIWMKACRVEKDKRYANVEQMHRAMAFCRKVPFVLAAVCIISALALIPLFIKRVEYRESVIQIQDTSAIKALQHENDSLQTQLNILKAEQEKIVKRKNFSDSVCRAIDLRMQRLYKPLLDTLEAIPYQDICYAELNKVMQQLTDVWQSYQNSTTDYELISAFNAYYTNVQQKYYNQSLSIIREKPLTETAE